MTTTDRGFMAALAFVVISHVEEGAMSAVYMALAVGIYLISVHWERSER